MNLSDRLALHAARRPDLAALSWPGGQLVYSALLSQVDAASQMLRAAGIRVLALDIENGPGWVALDIAAMQLGICLVPLPPFFSAGQLQHVLRHSGAEAVVTDNPTRLRARTDGLLSASPVSFGIREQHFTWIRITTGVQDYQASVPADVLKITYTSGTTGEPKGVMLSWAQIQPVVESLANAVELSSQDRHLALMPLAVLLENIGGVYASLWAGAEVVLLPMSEVGLSGSSGLNAEKMVQALKKSCATTAIFTPQTLQSVTEVLERNPHIALSLRFAAVGGAPISTRLLQRATDVGVPAFEGYGLSECASVVCLNTPTQFRPGSVGRPLPHVRLSISEDGEVLVSGEPFTGYLGEQTPAKNCWPTGDLGDLDTDGFLHLHGRRRNLFISAFGRNIAPEWVERELMLEPEIAQAAVFGEARPYNLAIIVPDDAASPADIDTALARCNSSLPDYATVSGWIQADAPFSISNNMLTGTGRVRRKRVLEHYSQTLESMYSEDQIS